MWTIWSIAYFLPTAAKSIYNDGYWRPLPLAYIHHNFDHNVTVICVYDATRAVFIYKIDDFIIISVI